MTYLMLKAADEAFDDLFNASKDIITLIAAMPIEIKSFNSIIALFLSLLLLNQLDHRCLKH